MSIPIKTVHICPDLDDSSVAASLFAACEATPCYVRNGRDYNSPRRPENPQDPKDQGIRKIDLEIAPSAGSQNSRSHWRGRLALAILPLLLWSAGIQPATAQYTILQTFNNTGEGGSPVGTLAVAGPSLYGAASTGGSSNGGVLFKINNDGTGSSVLHNFGVVSGDGSHPVGTLTVAGSALYGMTQGGGAGGFGVLFKINADGSGYTVLQSFMGGAPVGALTLVDSALYGVTRGGGTSGLGTLFKINTDGTGYAVLYNFTGESPVGALTFAGSTFYGLASGGGSFGLGVLFKINRNGTGYTILYNFDGGSPVGSLTLAGAVLYGMRDGGRNNAGGVFRINNDGTGFTALHDFNGIDGAFPAAALTLAGSTLYGMTTAGGSSGNGVVFQLDTAGSGFAILHNFSGTDGAEPTDAPTVAGSVLYGTTTAGGGTGAGVIFTLPITDACSDSIAPLNAAVGGGASTGTVTVTAGTGCSWTASSPVSWITITAGASGTGSGTVGYAVTASTNSRSATLTIAGQPFTVTQSVPAAPTISTAAGLPTGVVGTAYHATLGATGGVAPYTWMITAGELPAGLELDALAGTISGTPTASGSTNCIIRVMGNDGLYAEKTFSLTMIASSPRITTGSLLPSGGLGLAYSQNLLATGGAPPYSWVVNSANLPPGISLTGSLLSGTPTAVGSYYFAIRCTGSDGLYFLRQFQLSVSANGRVSEPVILPDGGTFTNSIKVTLSCATAGAVIRYTTNDSEPTSVSSIYQKKALSVTNSVTLKAKAFKTNLINSTTATAILIVIIPPPPSIATTSLTNATHEQFYSATLQLNAATGFPPYKWAWTPCPGYKLPAGLKLNSASGIISGTPTRAGAYSFTVKVTDAVKKVGKQVLTLIVN